MQELWSWSLPIGRLFGIAIRVHWTLLLITLFEVIQAAQGGVAGWMIPILVLVPFLSILLHEFGHSLTARVVGGDSRLIVMWMFGGLAMCDVPHHPGKRFVVAAAGPLVTFLIAAGCLLAIGGGLSPSYAEAHQRMGALGWVVAFTGLLNWHLLLFNLIPCYPLDGGSMLRSLLWPMVGLRRAIVITVYLAYVSIAGLLLYALWVGTFWLGLLAILLLLWVVQEHRMVRMGYDPYLGEATADAAYAAERDTVLGRWRRNRRRRQEERRRAQQAHEERELDRLLAKVGEEGLAALSPRERRFLETYSKKNR